MCSESDQLLSPEATSLHNNDQNRMSDNSSVYGPTSRAGGWQGGDYQNLLEGEGMASCDSSVGAWSEDGHLNQINAKKNRSKRDLQKRKRSSSIVHGTLVMRKDEQQKDLFAIPASFLQFPSTANSDLFSASFSSPLQKFPSTPARSRAGQLVPQLESPTTPRSFLPLPLQGQHTHSPLTRQISQERIDASPLDVASIVASGWAIEPEEYSNEDNDYSTEAASALIDNLLLGVQEGFLTSAVVDSPSRLSVDDGEFDDDDDSQAGWETDDCEITPRLRKVWQEVETSSVSSTFSIKRKSRAFVRPDSLSDSDTTSSAPNSRGRRQSFIRVPSAIFPHTPAQAKAERRRSNQSITSTTSSITRRSRLSRLSSGSSSSTLSISEGSAKRRSIHTAPTPRPMSVSRKSKYYSRPAQPGSMPFIKQQHLKGARGKFWSPMNSLYISNDEDLPVEEIQARQSTRYSRRSGQAWVRPRTFEVKDQYRVTIYPPQVEDPHCRREVQEIKAADPDKTPTQAQFKVVQVAEQSRPVSRASRTSVSCRLPLGPPPNRMLPPVPTLDSVPRQTRKLSRRVSRNARLSQATINSTATSASCSQCQQSDFSSCSCSQSYADGSSSYRASTHSGTYSISQTETYSEDQRETYTESQSCSCTDASTCSCTMTRSSMVESQMESVLTPRQSYFGYRDRPSLDKAGRVLGLPQSAPLYASSAQPRASVYANQPRSAPYYTSEYPPVLEPLPRFSPFRINFDHIFGKRVSKRWSRYSTSGASSRTSSSSRCSTCIDGSQLAYLSEGAGSTSDGTLIVSSSLSYDSDSRSCSSSSPSSSSPMSELESDNGSEQDSDMPSTPTRSEYQSSFGLSESPGYRMSFIVSPMPQSAKRHSQTEELLMFSPQQDLNDKDTDESRLSALRPISQLTSTTTTGFTTTSSNLTASVNGSRVPRSILKTSSRYREISQESEVNHRRPAVSMAVDTIFKSGSSTFSGKTMSTSSSSSSLSSMPTMRAPASSAPQRATLATSTLTRQDLEGRIQREENRRKRNESRLYALEKLEGKTKKSSLFFSLLSNASSAATSAGGSVWQEQEEDLSSPLPQTPLTPAKMDLLELERQLERRQRITQFQNNKAVSFTDVSGFDMGTCPRISKSASSDEQDAVLKLQLKKLSTAIEARQYAKDKCIDK